MTLHGILLVWRWLVSNTFCIIFINALLSQLYLIVFIWQLEFDTERYVVHTLSVGEITLRCYSVTHFWVWPKSTIKKYVYVLRSYYWISFIMRSLCLVYLHVLLRSSQWDRMSTNVYVKCVCTRFINVVSLVFD